MGAVAWGVRLAVLAATGLLVAVVVLSTVTENSPPHFVLTERGPEGEAGAPLAVPTALGATEAQWNRQRVLVFVVPAALLEGVDEYHGGGEATPSIPVPGQPGLRMFAISAASTHLGCTVAFNADLGASRLVADYDGDGGNDGRLMDVCHQMQWDPYHRGALVAGPTDLRRLAVLDLAIQGGRLVATGFDGPVGPRG